ncbi:MAG: GxGYxYP family putative glycoside hydrolase [Armatimonadetes bacterium]|nr:GxGYxYP family putative glycoside hydrolase [Armatimonadota bacterium]
MTSGGGILRDAAALTGCVLCMAGAHGAEVGVSRRIWPMGPPPAAVVDVVDVSAQTPAMRLTLTMLQGLANRGPRATVYLLHPGPSDAFWLERLKRKGYVRASKALVPADMPARYGRCYRKVFLYDPDLTGSMNAAVMLGSLENGLACAPDDAQRLAGGRPVVDLRGRWRTNAEALEWARRHLLPRMSKRLLASMNPQAAEISHYDYLVANRVFTFWITGEEMSDGVARNHGAERAVVEKVLRASRPNIPVAGFWFTGADPGINEYTGVGMAGETGQYTLVTSLCGNISLLSGVKVDWPAAVRRYQARLDERAAPALDRSKIYVCFEFTESGDSPFYLQHVQWKQWQDPQRGKLPFNWNVGPAVLDLAPAIMERFYDDATPNDFFFVALSGAGYNHPYRNLFAKVKEPERAWSEYLRQTRDYMRRMGLRDLQLYTDSWKPFDRKRLDPVTLRFIEGIPEVRSVELGMGRDGELTGDNGNYRLGSRSVLVSHCLTRWDTGFGSRTKEQSVDWLVNDVRAHAPTARPGFMHAMALSWTYNPTEYVEVMRRLGPEYVPVTLAEYVRLFNEANP